MALKLDAEVITLTTRHPFIIARGGRSEYRVVWVRLTDSEGCEGWGEADPSSYYGETHDTVLEVLRTLAPHLTDDPFDLETAEARFAQVVPKNGAARSALSAALHDLAGKRLGVPLVGARSGAHTRLVVHHRDRYRREDSRQGAGGLVVSHPQDQTRHGP